MGRTPFQSARGFTLVELMVVVLIVGILATILVPKFANIMEKSRDGATRGSLTAIRSALSVYYSDTEGVFPSAGGLASSLTAGARYLREMPFAEIRKSVHLQWASNKETIFFDDFTSDAAWFYTPAQGLLVVNCSHADTKGSIWSAW